MKVTIAIADRAANHWTPDRAQCRAWIESALAAADSREALGVSLCFIEAEESERLNRRYRRQGRPTNVLAFPSASSEPLRSSLGSNLIGDIAVCAELAEQEALAQGKELAHHWAHLLIHGCLHLLGYDHVDEEEAECMEALEVGILQGFGIPNPYLGAPTAHGRRPGWHRSGTPFLDR